MISSSKHIFLKEIQVITTPFLFLTSFKANEVMTLPGSKFSVSLLPSHKPSPHSHLLLWDELLSKNYGQNLKEMIYFI